VWRWFPAIVLVVSISGAAAHADRDVRKEGRTPANRGEFSGRSGWLCGGARHCKKRATLRSAISASAGDVASAHPGVPSAVTRALRKELARALGFACRQRLCSRLARGVVTRLRRDLRAAWTLQSVEAATAEVVNGGELDGWRATLRSERLARDVSLFCGEDVEHNVSCLIEFTDDADRPFRYHSVAYPGGHVMQSLDLLDDRGYLWIDAEMLALGGELSL
jgi:hypothetical protein